MLAKQPQTVAADATSDPPGETINDTMLVGVRQIEMSCPCHASLKHPSRPGTL